MKPKSRADRSERWLRELRAEHLHEPPRGTLAKAIALGARLPEGKPTGLVWIAKLVFDSSLSLVAAGVRGAASGERRFLYDVRPASGGEAVQLDLRVRSAAAGRLEVFGQLLPPVVSSRVEGIAGRTRRVAALGDDGTFVLRALPASPEGLRLRFSVAGRDALVLDSVPIASDRTSR